MTRRSSLARDALRVQTGSREATSSIVARTAADRVTDRDVTAPILHLWVTTSLRADLARTLVRLRIPSGGRR